MMIEWRRERERAGRLLRAAKSASLQVRSQLCKTCPIWHIAMFRMFTRAVLHTCIAVEPVRHTLFVTTFVGTIRKGLRPVTWQKGRRAKRRGNVREAKETSEGRSEAWKKRRQKGWKREQLGPWLTAERLRRQPLRSYLTCDRPAAIAR